MKKKRFHMPYDKEIDNRVQKIVSRWKGMAAKKMFGGVCHQLNGNILAGVHKNRLILRLGVDEADKALLDKDVVPFDITGRPMKGWVMVEKRGFETDAVLKDWLVRAKIFVNTLPPK
jgi:hypothetical protein